MLFWGCLIVVISVATTAAAQVKVYLEKGVVTLPSIKVTGAEFVPLTSLADALGKPLERRSARGSYRIRLGESVLLINVGSPEVRIGTAVAQLSVSPRWFGGRVIVPLELLPIALSARYGENRVDWDPDGRIARISRTAYSLRLLRFRTYPDHTRVVLEGTRPHDFILREDGVSGRVVLDIKRAILSPAIRSSQVSDGLVASIDTEQRGADSRLTIHGAGRRLWSKVFAIGGPDRIVVDLFPHEEQERHVQPVETLTMTTPGQPDQPKPATRRTESASSAEPATESVVRTVVIDPGHGGKDPGAIGPSGVKEKDIVLDISLRLKRLIEENLAVKVVLTRTEDVFIPLERRTMIANRHRADFFISVHVNAAPESRAVGFETYFLSREPSDRGARASAVRENTALNLEGVGQDAQRGLQTVLWDLAQTFYIRESSELAELLLNELAQSLKVDNRGVKSAPFFVLIGTAMPSVLVEVAFISNPQEEQQLEQEVYRQQVAEALLAGITRFKTRYEKRVRPLPAHSAINHPPFAVSHHEVARHARSGLGPRADREEPIASPASAR